MLTAFSLRLACGLIGCLLLLPSGKVNPRFFRTQFLVALCLTGVAAFGRAGDSGPGLGLALGAGILGALLGALSWSLEGAPGGKTLVVLTLVALLAGVALLDSERPSQLAAPESAAGWWLGLANGLSSAALLGTALSAMVLGHFYLIAPGMPIELLLRLLFAFFAAAGVRALVAGLGWVSFTATHALGSLDELTLLWLPVRWGVGLVGPVVLGWMAREAARIRSTQSATGILYVVVILCFLGELTSLLLHASGTPL